jgi:hypothetical protein
MIIVNALMKCPEELCTVQVNTHGDRIYIQYTYLNHINPFLSLMKLNIVQLNALPCLKY